MTGLVLGAAYTYSAADVWPFVSTLRRYYNGKIAFVVANNTDPSLIELCLTHGIDFFIVDGDVNNPIHMQWARFYHYPRVLAHPFFAECSEFFFTDVRDVFFQNSPFSLPMCTDLEFFTEPETIANSYVNRNWLRDKYGISATHGFESKLILCSGTIRTTRAGAYEVVKKMTEESDRLQGIGVAPLDQPQLNYLVYSGKFHNYRIFNNGEGTVSTMHFERRASFDPEGFLLNLNNSRTPVVHQWDRTNQLVPLFKRQWTPDEE